MIDVLKELCGIPGVSGYETRVADYIKESLKGVKAEIDIKTDALGNVLVFKKGRRAPKTRLMFAAHMDEVGFILNYISDDGFLKISPVGGINPAVVLGRQIAFDSGVTAVIGAKPVHLTDAEERGKQPKISDMSADIGAVSGEDAEKYVSLGDTATFVSDFVEFGEGFVKGKAIDDRLGCVVMLDMLKSELAFDTWFAFTVQEEIGTRGAKTAAYAIQPDVAIVLETTTACDFPPSEGEKRVCELGKGPVVSYMDRSAIYDKELYKLAFVVAKSHGISVQTKTLIAGGNDSGSIQRTATGARVIAISAPCRNLHSPACVVKRTDCMEMRILVEKLAEEVLSA